MSLSLEGLKYLERVGMLPPKGHVAGVDEGEAATTGMKEILLQRPPAKAENGLGNCRLEGKKMDSLELK